MPATDTMQVDTSRLSKINIIKKTGFLEGNNVTRLNGLLQSFFKDDGEFLSLELTKPPESTWGEEQMVV